jgi:hypothetical protein
MNEHIDVLRRMRPFSLSREHILNTPPAMVSATALIAEYVPADAADLTWKRNVASARLALVISATEVVEASPVTVMVMEDEVDVTVG